MNSAAPTKVFDFASSFRRTLDRFDSLAASSRTDYARAMEKRAQSEAAENERLRVILHKADIAMTDRQDAVLPCCQLTYERAKG